MVFVNNNRMIANRLIVRNVSRVLLFTISIGLGGIGINEDFLSMSIGKRAAKVHQPVTEGVIGFFCDSGQEAGDCGLRGNSRKKLRKKRIVLNGFLVFLSKESKKVTKHSLEQKRIIGVVFGESGSLIIVRKAGKWIEQSICRDEIEKENAASIGGQVSAVKR